MMVSGSPAHRTPQVMPHPARGAAGRWVLVECKRLQSAALVAQKENKSPALEAVAQTPVSPGVCRPGRQGRFAERPLDRRCLGGSELPCVRSRSGVLLPPSLCEWLPEDHLAWFVLDAVDEIDLSGFYGAYREDGWGRAAFEPAMT